MPEFVDSTIKVTVTAELVTRNSTGTAGWTFSQVGLPVKFNTGSDPKGRTVDDEVRRAAEQFINDRPPAPGFDPRRLLNQ